MVWRRDDIPEYGAIAIPNPVSRGWLAWLAGTFLFLSLTMGSEGAWASEGKKRLACSICQSLSLQMSGDVTQPFLFRSFEPANGGSALHPTLENTGFAYDNSLALMALYGCGYAEEARRVADAFVMALETDRHYHDGRLRNAYRSGPVSAGADGMLLPGYWNAVSNAWIEDGYQVGSASGSTAWGALGLLAAYDQSKQPAYLDAARKIMDWIHRAALDKENGGYYGGFFGHEPTPERLTWKSTEHNVDIYAADRWLARLDEGGDWRRHAEIAETFVKKMWEEDEGRFYIGTLPDGVTPNVAMTGLDAALWPLIALPSMKDKAEPALAWTERNHGVPGGFDFNDDRDGIWLEGTAQAALVYELTGHAEKAEGLFDTIKKQAAPGGLIYATAQDQVTTGLQVGPNSAPGDFKYFRLPHVGASAWAALAALQLNPFVAPSEQRPASEEKPCPRK